MMPAFNFPPKSFFITWVFSLFFFLLDVDVVFPKEARSPCYGEQATLECLKKNFELLADTDYSQWSAILDRAEGKAIKCDSLPDTAKYLELATIQRGYAEFSEYTSEVIEKLCVTNTVCCLDATLLLPKTAQKDLMKELQTPTFLIDALPQAFSTYKQNEKYKVLLEYYLKK